jgi:hypothetical protein
VQRRAGIPSPARQFFKNMKTDQEHTAVALDLSKAKPLKRIAVVVSLVELPSEEPEISGTAGEPGKPSLPTTTAPNADGGQPIIPLPLGEGTRERTASSQLLKLLTCFNR